MKNIGIKTKKFVRKITAIASAALMAGLSMGAAAADLSSLTSTFIANGEFKAYVVVGTGGQSNVVGFAQDVAGSIVVASAFAQQAQTTGSTSGSAVLSKNLTSGYVGRSISGALKVFESALGNTWTNGMSGYSWIANTTVTNSTGDSYANVTGRLMLVDGSLQQLTDGTVQLNSNGLVYNLTFNTLNDGSVFGNKAVTNRTSGIPFPDGKMYQITNWTAGGASESNGCINITLGEYTEVKHVGLGQVVALGTSGATLVMNATSTTSVRVIVRDSTGAIAKDDYFREGDFFEGNGTLKGISFNMKSLQVGGTVGADADIEWSTSAKTLVYGTNDTSWPNWTIKMTTDNSAVLSSSTGITSISWTYQPNTGYSVIGSGSSMSFLDGFFAIAVNPLVVNSTNKKESAITVKNAVDSNADISFVDENGTIRYVDVNLRSGSFGSGDLNISYESSLFNTQQWKLQCFDDAGLKVNLSNMASSKAALTLTANAAPVALASANGLDGMTALVNISVLPVSSGCTDAQYNFSIMGMTSIAGNPINGSLVYAAVDVATNSVNGTVTLTDPNAKAVVVTYKNGLFDSVKSDNAPVTLGSLYYSKFYGTRIDYTATQVVMSYPEAVRVGKISIGRTGTKEYTLSAGSYNSELDVTLLSSAGTSATIKPIDVGLAMLDSEVSTASLDRPIVLLGGPAVNSLVSTLVTGGKVDMSVLSSNRALVQLVSNAFNSQSALVIAGWAGQDTRLAAQVVASQVLGKLSILSGSSSILNTGVTSYTGVTVV